MTSQEWLAGYLEQGAQEPGPYAPDAASADAARRLRDLLADPDGWAEPPAGLLDQILAGVDSERVRPAGPPRPRMRRTHSGRVALHSLQTLEQRNLAAVPVRIRERNRADESGAPARPKSDRY